MVELLTDLHRYIEVRCLRHRAWERSVGTPCGNSAPLKPSPTEVIRESKLKSTLEPFVSVQGFVDCLFGYAQGSEMKHGLIMSFVNGPIYNIRTERKLYLLLCCK